MIHGLDVARAILAVHFYPSLATGQRWLLTDGRVYDWWDLAGAWGAEGAQPRWVRELMDEAGVRALPRSVVLLAGVPERRLDGEARCGRGVCLAGKWAGGGGGACGEGA